MEGQKRWAWRGRNSLCTLGRKKPAALRHSCCPSAMMFQESSWFFIQHGLLWYQSGLKVFAQKQCLTNTSSFGCRSASPVWPMLAFQHWSFTQTLRYSLEKHHAVSSCIWTHAVMSTPRMWAERSLVSMRSNNESKLFFNSSTWGVSL